MKRVLIVDDAPFMRAALKNMIEKHNYSVVGEAENGFIAVDKYKELKPDIVTMDITMPEMDGITALKKIREYDKNAAVVIVSALGQESMVMNAITSGAKNFVVKPFKEDGVIGVLNKL